MSGAGAQSVWNRVDEPPPPHPIWLQMGEQLRAAHALQKQERLASIRARDEGK
jgi:hypothetical protein